MEQEVPPAGLYDSQAPHILVIIVVFPSLAALAILHRLYTRVKIIANPAMDDWCIVFFSIATSVCMGFQVHYGMGQHMAALTMQDGLNSLKALFASIITYNFGLLFTKLSILLQYLRICSSKPVMYGCYAMLGLVVLNGIQTFITAIFTCIPVAFFWDPTIPGGRCINESALWFSNAAINIMSDFLLLALPIFILKSLLLPKRQKIGLAIILALGGFACIASILRLHALYIVTISKDITWDNPGTATWSAIELNVGIICTSFTALKPLLWRFMPSLFGPTYKHNSGTGHPYSRNQARRGSTAAKSGTFEAVDEISLHRDIEICGSGGKRSFSSAEGRENSSENEAYVIQGIDRV